LNPVIPEVIDLGDPFRRPLPQAGPRIAGLDHAAYVGDRLLPVSVQKPRTLAIERKAQRIEDRRLARPSVAGDREEARRPKRLGLEVHLEFLGQAREVTAPDGEDAHLQSPALIDSNAIRWSALGLWP
jgi:hypothetical protein